MCLLVEYDSDATFLAEGRRTARKLHRCMECGRDIEPGETYRYWSYAYEGQAFTDKMCAHCQASIDLGSMLTGCPKVWNGSMLWDRDPEVGFVANCAWRDEHPNLPEADRRRLLRQMTYAKRGWRRSDGMKRSPMPPRRKRMPRGKPLDRSGRLAPISPTRRTLLDAYRAARDQVRTRARGLCELRTPVCVGQGSEAHHLRGRVGPLLTAVAHMRWTCRKCHDYVGANPAEAYRMGWLEYRNGAYEDEGAA